MKKVHFITALKQENADLRAEIQRLKDAVYSAQNPEIPVYVTYYDGQGCAYYVDKGNEKNRSLSGCMDKIECLFRANGAPVFDISNVSIPELLRISDLPLEKRIAALDALFVPKILRY